MEEYNLEFEVNEHEVRVSLNKEEDIRKLMLEEDLGELKRAQFLLMKGQYRQKLAVYRNIGRLLNQSFEGLYQYFKADLLETTEEYQIEAAKGLLTIKTHHKDIFYLCLHFLQLYNQRIAEFWVPLFELILENINYKEHEKQIEKMALNLSENKQPEVGRLIGTQIITKIVPYLKNEIRGPLLDRCRVLFKDIDEEVRETAAGPLMQALMEHLSSDLLEYYVNDKLFELLYDSSLTVKKNAVKTLYLYQHRITRGDQNNRLLSAILDCLSTQHEPLLLEATKHVGLVFQNCQDIADEEFNKKFAEAYCKTGQNTSEEVRWWYLYNLPGIMLNLNGIYTGSVFTHFNTIILKDSKKNKMEAATIMHELIKLFDQSRVYQKFGQLFDCILQHEELDVILCIQIDGILAQLQSDEPEIKTHLSDITKYLGKLLERSSKNHNQNRLFLTQVLKFEKYIVPIDFEERILPYLFKPQATLDCDQMAVQVIAQFFSSCRNYSLQQKIKDYMNSYVQGNYKQKIKYIYWVAEISKFVSGKRFRDMNCPQVLNLCQDKSKSVQFQLIKKLSTFMHYLDPIEYGILKQMQGSKSLIEAVKVEFTNLKPLNFPRNDLEKQEDLLLQEFQAKKVLKQDDQAADYINKYLKRPLIKQSTTKKAQSGSRSVRNDKSMQDITPQASIQRSRRFTEVLKTKVKQSAYKS